MSLGWDRVIDESIDAKTQYVQTDLEKKLKPRRKSTNFKERIIWI